MNIEKLLLAHHMVQGGKQAVRVATNGVERCGDGSNSGSACALRVAEDGLQRYEDELKSELEKLGRECQDCFARFTHSINRDQSTKIGEFSFDVSAQTFGACLVTFACDPEEEVRMLNIWLAEYNAALKAADLPFACTHFSLLGF